MVEVLNLLKGILIPIAVFTAIVLPIIFIARYRHNERMQLLRQGINPAITLPEIPGKKSLLGGLVLIFLGSALLIYSLVVHKQSDILKFSIVFLSIGAALLVYWKVTAPERQRLTKLYEEKLLTESASSM